MQSLLGALRLHVPTEREVTSGLIATLMQCSGVVRLAGEEEEKLDDDDDNVNDANGEEKNLDDEKVKRSKRTPTKVAPVLALEYLSLKKLRGIYQKIRLCMEQALQMSVAADANTFLVHRMDHLRRAAEKHIKKEVARLGDASPPFALTPESSALLLGIPHQFRIHGLSFDCTLAGRDRQGSKWPRRNARKPLEEIVSDYLQCAPTDGRRMPLRIMIDGGDREFHHVVSALVSVLDAAKATSNNVADVATSESSNDEDETTTGGGEGVSQPSAVTDKLDILLYLLPSPSFSRKSESEGNTLSTYLSSVDPWFSKTSAVNLHAASAFTPHPLVENESASRDPVIGSHRLFLSPPFVLQSMLADFVALGQRRRRLSLFQCECWQKSVSQKKADTPSKYIIPFALSAQVGLGAQARSFQLLNDLPASLSIKEIAACKAFRFVPPTLTIRMSSASLSGAVKPEPEIEARPWQEISMGLIPVEGSSFDQPDPPTAWLEMFANAAGDPINSSAADKKRKATLRNQYRYHAQSVEIESFGMTTFDICLDGTLYGPFERVSITPCIACPEIQVMSYY